MTAIKMVPISLETATGLLVFLREADLDEDDIDDAHAFTRTIGEAISIAGEHVGAAEMLCAELLELIGRVSGRPLSTIPSQHSLSEATKALEDMTPALGTVLHLPRPANLDPKAVDAAAVRALADMPGPISLRPFFEKPFSPDAMFRPPSPESGGRWREGDPVDVWQVPAKGDVWCGYLVCGREWDSPHSVRVFLEEMS